MSRISEHAQSDLFAPPSLLAGIPEEVSRLFESLSLSIIKAGYKRYSADAVLHRLRWTFQIEKNRREFKINDHWSAPLARWFLANHPEAAGFFETRERVLS